LTCHYLLARCLGTSLTACALAAGWQPAAALAGSASGGTAPSPGAGALGSAPLTTTPGARARLLRDGTAQAPESAPEAVQAVIAAGNRIARLPYRYGGGHGRWNDTGYDCSGSVSYALHGAGLLQESAPATGFYRYGQSGAGRWITIYANGSHMYMVVAGLRFDTSGRSQTGSRWQVEQRSPDGFVVRHPTGL
jgi:cell wall-associated NlpC family hydrolase